MCSTRKHAIVSHFQKHVWHIQSHGLTRLLLLCSPLTHPWFTITTIPSAHPSKAPDATITCSGHDIKMYFNNGIQTNHENNNTITSCFTPNRLRHQLILVFIIWITIYPQTRFKDHSETAKVLHTYSCKTCFCIRYLLSERGLGAVVMCVLGCASGNGLSYFCWVAHDHHHVPWPGPLPHHSPPIYPGGLAPPTSPG